MERNKLITPQPLNGSLGAIFYIKYRYGQGKEECRANVERAIQIAKAARKYR